MRVKWFFFLIILAITAAVLAFMVACGDDDDDDDNDDHDEEQGCCYWGCDAGDFFSKDVENYIYSESECLEVATNRCGYEPYQYELVWTTPNCDETPSWWENFGL